MKMYPKQAKAARKSGKGMKAGKPAKRGKMVELGSIKPRKTAVKKARKRSK